MTPSPTFSFGPRDKHEPHRAATPLELMFDLAAVIAVAAAAHGLAHAVEAGHIVDGVIGFLTSFFMIWWAWMNYTWFASAYDDNSPAFRVLSMVIMFGALVLAAGIKAVFAREPLWLGVLGFVIMRLGMAAFWIGAARGDPERRRTALAYAAGIVLMQVYWIVMIVLVAPTSAAYLPLFVLGMIGELAVPVVAERRGVTTWHRHHIIERYGLLNIIVLGECFIAIVAMIQLDAGSALPSARLLSLAVVSAVIAFSLWGLYFTDEEHLATDELRHAILWGYGHFAIFASGAATGAGLVVQHMILTHKAHVDTRIGALAVAIPVAIYLLTLWLIRDRVTLAGAGLLLLPASAAIVLITGALSPAPLAMIAAVLVVTVTFRRTCRRADAGGGH